MGGGAEMHADSQSLLKREEADFLKNGLWDMKEQNSGKKEEVSNAEG